MRICVAHRCKHASNALPLTIRCWFRFN